MIAPVFLVPPSLIVRQKNRFRPSVLFRRVREPLTPLIGITLAAPHDANIVVREWRMYARYLNLRHVTRDTVLRAHRTARRGATALPFFRHQSPFADRTLFFNRHLLA